MKLASSKKELGCKENNKVKKNLVIKTSMSSRSSSHTKAFQSKQTKLRKSSKTNKDIIGPLNPLRDQEILKRNGSIESSDFKTILKHPRRGASNNLSNDSR